MPPHCSGRPATPSAKRRRLLYSAMRSARALAIRPRERELPKQPPRPGGETGDHKISPHRTHTVHAYRQYGRNVLGPIATV